MAYRNGSHWNDRMELECLRIFLLAKEALFRRGFVSHLCAELAMRCSIPLSSLKAKVGNYKSEAGLSGSSNSSEATKEIFRKYGCLKPQEIQEIIEKIQK